MLAAIIIIIITIPIIIFMIIHLSHPYPHLHAHGNSLSCSHLPYSLPIGPNILWCSGSSSCLPSQPQDPVVPTSDVRTAGASPRAWCAIPGAWTTVAMAVTRLRGQQPTAEVSDRGGLGPAEHLG